MTTTDRLRALTDAAETEGFTVNLIRVDIDTLRRLIDLAEGLAREGDHSPGCLAATIQGEACHCGWGPMLADWDAFQQEGGE